MKIIGSETYDIEDAGIGSFLEGFVESVTTSAAQQKLDVRFIENENGDEVEVIFKDSTKGKIFFAYRIRAFFESKTTLPVRIELYNWENQPTGIYYYDNLRANIGDNAAEFKKHINGHLYRAYRSDSSVKTR